MISGDNVKKQYSEGKQYHNFLGSFREKEGVYLNDSEKRENLELPGKGILYYWDSKKNKMGAKAIYFPKR